VLELCNGVDILVHDGQYTDDEFSVKSDWGHSTAAYAVHVAAEAGVKRLLLSHHDPSHTDRELDKILNAARKLPEAKRVEDLSSAKEGQVIDLGTA
jgi:ribonuclease BN (tRNA processing enzyme)